MRWRWRAFKWELQKLGDRVCHAFGYKIMKRSEWESLPLAERVAIARSGYKFVD